MACVILSPRRVGRFLCKVYGEMFRPLAARHVSGDATNWELATAHRATDAELISDLRIL